MLAAVTSQPTLKYQEVAKPALQAFGSWDTLAKIAIVAACFFAVMPPPGSGGIIIAVAILAVAVPLIAAVLCSTRRSEGTTDGRNNQHRGWSFWDVNWLPTPQRRDPPSPVHSQTTRPGAHVGVGGGHATPPPPPRTPYVYVQQQPPAFQLPPQAPRPAVHVGVGGGHQQAMPQPGARVAVGGGHR